MPFKILMVDDHKTMLIGYKSILEFNDKNLELDVTFSHDCEDAYTIITSSDASSYDLVFLDRSLPPYLDKKIKSGEDLAVLVRKQLPDAKIIMLTSHAEAFVIYDIVHKIRPNGLLIKSDFDGDELLIAFNKILNDETYFSETVTAALKEQIISRGYLDTIDRQIITLLSKGLRNKTIASELGLSDSAVEKRKVKIKDYLNIYKGNDEDIITECRRLGFI
ncbi:response regulator transcription factor [Flavobacterium sp.]|uniref:response regulator transcription factor n=1 Tax=Flavobacterium sp. TaxID=239 RepID=UPI002B4AC1D2|nr:response regulator transcription factor [Flavobacterium sp.]HLP63215.1 response regulator transcription factor [Flavobacterium sp.]